MAIAIGIDFGTCFSAAGFKNGDHMMALIPQNERRSFFPSVFYHDKNQTLVGTSALNYGSKKPQFLVEHIKKKLKEPFIPLDDETYTPKEIVREILQYLLEGVDYDLRDQFQLPDEELFVVIAVPVKFQDGEIRMIREAAMEVKLPSGRPIRIGGIIQEPVAAALEYLGLVEEAGLNVFVYDLGGGTFDIAIMQSTDDVLTPFVVVGQDARPIGGCDWDADLAVIIRDKVKYAMLEDGMDEEKAESTLNQMEKVLVAKAREVKEMLTEEESVNELIFYKGEEYEFAVTREEFEESVSDLKKETIQAVKRLRKKCSDYSLDKVIMVGGGSHMPHIKEAVEKEFGDCGVEIKVFNPELAIAYGAARYAKLLQEKERPVLLKAPHSYGLGFVDAEGKRYIQNMIYKDEELPVTVKTKAIKKTYNYFPVFETDSEMGVDKISESEGHEIMQIQMICTKEALAGAPELELTLSKDCILELKIIDHATGKQIKHEMKLDSVIY